MSLLRIAEDQAGVEGLVGAEAPATGAPASRLGAVLALSGGGLLVQAVGDAVARAGHDKVGLDLFFVGVVTVFASCAWRLLGARAGRDERLAVAVVLGLALVLSSWMASPLLFDGYDELLHETTLWQLLDHRRLFSRNTVLPVSPWYPGLELLTVAVRWTTGLPTAAAELVVVGMSRLVLVVTLFLFGERVTSSARAAGVVVLVYALSPQFYAFNATFSYQPLALAFGAATVYFTLRAGDATTSPRWWRDVTLALASMAAATVTHHLTGWLTVGLLVTWAVAARLDARRDAAAARRASTIRFVAAASALISAAWTAVTAPQVFPYLAPVFKGAWVSLAGLLGHGGRHRTLFHNASGYATPRWQEAVVVFSVLVSVALVTALALRLLARRKEPRLFQRVVLVVVSLGYVGVLASPLEGASSQVGQRGSTFVYLAVALLTAAWLLRFLRRVPLAALVVVTTAAFLGGLIWGSGASWSYVPGPYVPVSDQRSIDAPSIAAARWAASHLPVGSPVAADRDNSVLLAAVGHLAPVTAAAGEVNVGLLYFDTHFGSFERRTIRRYDIRYLVVDTRLLEGPPYYGTYFEPGVPPPGARNRLTKEELAKFASAPGLRAVYSNGPITIYDAAGLLGTGRPASPQPPIGPPGSTVRYDVLVPALAVAAAWLLVAARRRRRRRGEPGEGMALLVAGMAGSIAAMFAYVPSGLPTEPFAWTVLGLLAVLAAWAWRAAARRAPADGDAGAATSAATSRRTRRVVEGALGAVGVVALVAATTVAVASDRHAWRVVNAVSVTRTVPGRTLAGVSLAAGSRRGDRLEIVRAGRAVASLRLAAVAAQRVVLPAAATRPGARVVLVVHGRPVAEVSA